MAKIKKSKIGDPVVKDRTIFWQDLHYMPAHLKNEVWFAQAIYFAKKNSRLFLDPKLAREYRAMDSLKVDENALKQMVDPTTPMGNGGKADYFSSDWRANPAYIRLKNGVKAELQRTAKQLEVNFIDKYAKTRQMKHNYRIHYKNLFRDLINEYAPIVGLPTISASQDPYKWAKNHTQQQQEGDQGKPVESDLTEKYIDLIQNQIQNDQDLVLYNELLYKGDYEQAMEKGLQHYMVNQNKWNERYSDKYIDDCMHFNKMCGEWMTDLVTGRPLVGYFNPDELWVSPFKQKDGSDILYYFFEHEITFADFVRQIGGDLKTAQLKAVYDYNKTQGATHRTDWGDAPNRLRDNAMIRVGKFACLTQNYDGDIDTMQPSYTGYQSSDLSWQKMSVDKDGTLEEKNHYNVWYTCDYIPPTTNSLTNADYSWQAQFIFNIRKNQDQFRYGEDGRYSQCPLVIYDNSHQATFTDIVKAYMPKINYAWLQVQNCLVNDVDAMVMSTDFLNGLLSAVDEENKVNVSTPGRPSGGNGQDASMEQWKMIKQAGRGFLNMTDKQGNPLLDPSKLVVYLKNGYLERCEKFLTVMALLYNDMVRDLLTKDAADLAKPRTSVASTEEAIKSSGNATWFIQKGYEEFYKSYAERFVQYILMINKEAKDYNYTKRLDEFKDVLGVANALAIAGMEDVPPEKVGLTVSYVDNTAKKDFVMQIATDYMKQGKLDEDFLYLILGVDNWKVGYLLMRIGIKMRKKEQAHMEELQHQRAMEEKKADFDIANALNAGKGQAKDQNIMTKAKMDAMVGEAMDRVKAKTMSQQKEQIKNNRIEQDKNKANLDRQEKVADALSPSNS